MTDKLCAGCIAQLNESFGEDVGLSEADEFYDMFSLSFAGEWVEELCKDWLDISKIMLLITSYSSGDFSECYKASIEWLLKKSGNENDFEDFLFARKER